jgi:hypothetical protein
MQFCNYTFNLVFFTYVRDNLYEILRIIKIIFNFFLFYLKKGLVRRGPVCGDGRLRVHPGDVRPRRGRLRGPALYAGANQLHFDRFVAHSIENKLFT